MMPLAAQQNISVYCAVRDRSGIIRDSSPAGCGLRMTFMREPLGRSNSPAEFAHRRYGAFAQCAVKKHFRFQP